MSKPIRQAPNASTAVQNASSPTPMITPATVRLAMRHAFGVADGCTLSVVNDMPRKSPVIITSTISNGVRIAWPVITSPTARKST
jgi:hypothetical protein